MKKVVILPDIHYPEHSKKSIKLVLKLIKDLKPDEIIYQGDNLDMGAISHWNKDKKRKVELKRLQKDYNGFIKDVLTPIERAAGKNTKFVWLDGNHSFWAEQYLDKNPELEGMIEPRVCLALKERGYKYIPFNQIYKLGKLNIIHGYYTNKYHTAKTLDAFGESVCYGHVHSPQMTTRMKTIDSNEFHAAYSLPCLCELSPDYMKNRPTAWVNGFGVVYVMPDGMFNLYTIIISNNSFVFNNKIYK